MGWWKSLHNSFVLNSKDNGGLMNVLFYGDSITSEWSTTGYSIFLSYYASLGSANYGISGDRIEHLLWRIQNGEVNWIQPRVVVLMIGTNNIYINSDSEITLGIFTVVRELRERLPLSKILLLGILPRSNRKLAERIIAINQFISQSNDDDMIHFLDMTDHFYNKTVGTFSSELYHPDMLHLSKNGYQKWAEVADKKFRDLIF
jgi:lysophospholipase L1-like esterase